MTNKRKTTLYIGVTSDLKRRISEHKQHFYNNNFTDRYEIELLIYYEKWDTIVEAIVREKQLKGWIREKKENLINSKNPGWRDLWYEI